MARKSRYTSPLQDISDVRPHCIAAIYLRLSVEDGDSLESNSIGNQRKICLAFLEKHSDFEIGAFYVDDGCTGMNYKRPGFQSMFADLRAKKANCIIVKDISRLGRHYIMTSEYVEKVFPEMGVRLICINDDYDSEDAHSDRDGLLMPFKLVMNDTYVKDTARRIQSSIHAKMDSGEYLPSSGSVPYGYQRAPEKGTFEIDSETAPVVRRIFEMRAEGMMFNAIAKTLDQEGIPSPGKIRYDRGITRAEKFKNALWLRGTIRKLTGDAVYTGNRIHGRVTRERLGGDKKARPKELWQIIPDAHLPIVTQELFDQVQEVNRAELERRAAYDKRDNPDPDYRDIFRGKVFCGECGAKMTAGILAGRKTTPVSVYFNCNQYRYSNHRRCSNHYIRQETLMDTLKHFLDKQMEIAVDVERLATEMRRIESTPDSAQNRLASLRHRRMNLEAKQERLLEDVTTGILDRDEYIRIKARYRSEHSLLEEQEQNISRECERIKAALGTAETWLAAIRRYREIPRIDREIVDVLVDRILVFEDRSIRISMTYGNPYALLETCLDGDVGGASHVG